MALIIAAKVTVEIKLTEAGASGVVLHMLLQPQPQTAAALAFVDIQRRQPGRQILPADQVAAP
ncbi:hypothetical protein D3C86_2098040 [compost metagenome]